MEAGATLRADATASGAGGRVIVWANEATRFHGELSARGGAAGGDGGFAEVSGKQYLDFSGTVDLSAAAGAMGSLLLDPQNLTIDNSTDHNTDGTGPTGDPFVPTGTSSVLTWATLKAALTKGHVFVTTTGAGGSVTGDIVIGASPTGGYDFDTNLSLTTASTGGIVVNGAITNAGTGDLIFNAGSKGITLNASLSFAGGTIAFTHAGALTQTAGTVTAATLTLSGNGAVGSSGNLVDVNIAALHFRYRISGDDPPWRPAQVFDDGSKVYVQFPPGIAQGDMPPLFILGAPGGKAEIVNYRVHGNTMIVDRLFAAAELRLGAGPQQVVRITRTDGHG